MLTSAIPHPTQTERLFVLFDAGETTALLPIMQELEKLGKDFRVIVMATAETRITPDMFKAKRLTLADLGVTEKIDAKTPRTTKLSKESLQIIASKISTPTVIVGTAARIQRQIFKKAFPHAVCYACPDNFNYDPTHESYLTVRKVAVAAKHVLCPDADIVALLKNDEYVKSKAAKNQTNYQVVGKASLDTWEHYIQQILSPNGIAPLLAEKKEKIAQLSKEQGKNQEAIEKITTEVEQLEHTQQEIIKLTSERKRTVTLIGGYGPGYDVVDPLFDSLVALLKEKLKCEVFYQLHPRVLGERALAMGKQAGKAYITTEQALALTKLTNGVVIGYNSSVPYEAALLGIDACYMAPDKTPPFNHKAVNKGLVPAVKTNEELLDYIRKQPQPRDLRKELQIPTNTTEIILKAIKAIPSALES